jgi:glutaredoxin-like protein
MGMFSEKDRERLAGILKTLTNDVRIEMFTQEFECDNCKMTRELLEEISKISDKILLEEHYFEKEADLAKKYGVDKIPATILIGDRDYGIRFYGVPAGYEFTTLIGDIINISHRDPGLTEEVLAELSKIDRPVHIQIIISPTCPYCASAVSTAHRFAMVNDFITADMIESVEFPHLVVKYDVKGVPKIIINEQPILVGSPPEIEFAQLILKAIGK